MLLGNGSLEGAMQAFTWKFKDKTAADWEKRLNPDRAVRRKPVYTFVEKKYEDDSSDDDHLSEGSCRKSNTKSTNIGAVPKEVESTLPESVQLLMKFIFNHYYFADTMKDFDYDADKLPLGKLSKNTLQRGFQTLRELEDLFKNPRLPDYGEAVMAKSNSFYSMIPHNFYRNRPPVISSEVHVRKEMALLESLSDMGIANEIMEKSSSKGEQDINALDRQFAGLGLHEMTPRKSIYNLMRAQRLKQAICDHLIP